MSVPPKGPGQPALAAYARLMVMAAEGAALVEAARSGLLDLLVHAETPVADPAGAMGLHPQAVERLLGVLQAAGVVRHDAAGWGPTALLLDAHHHGVGRLDGLSTVFGAVRGFADHGHLAPAFQDRPHSADVVAGLGRRSVAAADDLARQLGPTPGDILDLGAGSAVWSLAMASLDPSTRVVAVDRPAVLAAARALAKELGLTDQLDTLPGELGHVGLPAAGFQRVVIANVLHLFDDPGCARLLAWAAPALRPGGQLIIVDVTEASSDDGRRALAAYALHLRLRHETGTVRLADAFTALLAQAGLHSPQVFAVEGGLDGITAVVATRA